MVIIEACAISFHGLIFDTDSTNNGCSNFVGGNILKMVFFLKHKIIGLDFSDNLIKYIKFENKKIKVDEDTTIISTLPLTYTARLLGFNSNLKFRGIRSVYVALNQERCFKKNINWIYFSDKKFIFNRISEPKSMSKYLCPKNKTYLCLEICYSKND